MLFDLGLLHNLHQTCCHSPSFVHRHYLNKIFVSLQLYRRCIFFNVLLFLEMQDLTFELVSGLSNTSNSFLNMVSYFIWCESMIQFKWIIDALFVVDGHSMHELFLSQAHFSERSFFEARFDEKPLSTATARKK